MFNRSSVRRRDQLPRVEPLDVRRLLNASFTPIAIEGWSTTSSTVDTFAGDLNGDGFPDIVGTHVGVFIGQSELTVGASPSLGLPPPPTGWMRSIAGIIDLDNDGRDELMVNLQYEGSRQSAIYSLNASGQWNTRVSFSHRSVIPAGDVDRNGWDDVVLSFSNDFELVFNREGILDFDGRVFVRSSSTSGYAPTSQYVSDIDMDGDFDLFYYNNAGSGEWPWVQSTRLQLNAPLEYASFVDFNHDGHIDAAGFSSSSWPYGLRVMLNDGIGGFGAPFRVSSAPEVSDGRFVPLGHRNDLNGDGLSDFITHTTGGLQLWLSNAAGSYAIETISGVNRYLNPVDIGLDGDMDFVVISSNSTAIVLRNNTGPYRPSTPAAPTLDLESDSGFVTADRNTSAQSISLWIEGVQETAAVSVFRDGVLLAERIGPGEVVDASAPEGVVSYTVQQTVDGRTSLPSTPLVVTIDRTAPAAPSAPVLQASSDSGFSNADRITNVTTPTFDIASTDSFYRAFVNGVQVGGDYLTGPFTAPALPEGVHIVSIRAVDAAGNVSEAGVDVTITIDTTAPTVAQSTFVFEVGHVLEFLFDDLITGAPTSDHLTVLNLTTGAAVPSSLAYLNPRATFSFPQFASGLLREGNYRATLAVPNLTDRAGNVGTASATLDFHVLTGDINRNRIVDFGDLLAVAQNYGQFGRTFSQGNVDYSGDSFVGFNDLLTLAQSYGRSLLVAPAPETSSRVGIFSRSKRRIGEELAESLG